MFNFFRKQQSQKYLDYDFCAALDEKFYPKYLIELYKKKMGYKFQLTLPQNINEIIQYLKLYDNNPIKEELSDKALVNNYVLKTINNPKIIKEVYEIHNSLSDINFASLPDKFIIKRNNASKYNLKVIKKDTLSQKDINYILSFFKEREHINYAFANGFELQYKNIKNKYIIERLYPKACEWQISCTNGIPLCVHCLDTDHIYFNNGFYINFNINEKYQLTDNFEQKSIVQEMIEMAKYLSKGFKFVRVDFMLVNKEYTFFQEMTFTPFSGFSPYYITHYASNEIGKIIEYK